MTYENDTFRKAARAVGIKGNDWQGNDALNDFSTYYHNNWKKGERETDGYNGIYSKAQDWWANNRQKYS